MNLTAMAQEAVGIAEARQYRTFSGQVHQLPQERGGTYIPPEQSLRPLPPLPQMFSESVFQVTPQTTLAALRDQNPNVRVAALNFASAKNPGGGFLRGTQAQEESIARSSTLYTSLLGSPYYQANRRQRGGLYTDGTIWSPEVWVFRDDHGQLLEQPYKAAFITCPAVNHNALIGGERLQAEATMVRRGRRILEIAAHYMTDVLVLGAWGCGVFGNDPSFVAQMWANHLSNDFAGIFGKVVFPIPNAAMHRIFERVFG